MSTDRLRVAVLGASGYSGLELLRIVLRHPRLELAVVDLRAARRPPVGEAFPSLRGLSSLRFEALDAGAPPRAGRRRLLLPAPRHRRAGGDGAAQGRRPGGRPLRRLPPPRPRRLRAVVRAPQGAGAVRPGRLRHPRAPSRRAARRRARGRRRLLRDRGPAAAAAVPARGPRRAGPGDRRREVRRLGRGPQARGRVPLRRARRERAGLQGREPPPRRRDGAGGVARRRPRPWASPSCRSSCR